MVRTNIHGLQTDSHASARLQASMGEALARESSLLAFVVTLALSVWCLSHAPRTAPTLLHALLLCSFAFWTGFEYLSFRHGIRTYSHLAFVGTTMAVCF